MILKRQEKLSSIAILCFCFICYFSNSMGSVVQTVADAFQVSSAQGRLVVTLPNASCFFTALLAGKVAGIKVGYRKIFIAACVFWIVGGLMPIFFHQSYALVLFSRVIYGFGIGFGLSYNTYMMEFYRGEKREKMIGYGIALCNAGGLLVTLLGGYLGEISWMAPFHVYWLCIPVLILIVLFLKEPEKNPDYTGENTVGSDETGKQVFNLNAVIFPLSVFCFGILLTPQNSGMSTLVANRGLGQSFVTSMILALHTVGGIVIGYILSAVKRLGRFAVPLMLMLQSIGFVLILTGYSVPVLAFACLLTGIGYFAIKPLFSLYLNETLARKSVTLITMIIFACTNLGIFFSNLWIQVANLLIPFFQTELENAIFGSAVLFFTAALFYAIYNPIKEKGRRYGRNA